MVVVRRIVFPALRLVVWAVIAAALVKIAFLDQAAVTSPVDRLEPSFSLEAPQVQVTTGTVENTVTVAASVVADPASDVRATLAGTVHALLVSEGQAVAAGAPLVELRSETPVEPTVRTDPATGVQTVVENRPKVTRETVTAPVAGTVRLTVLKGQVVTVGETIGSVRPGTLSVSGQLTPDQQYRLVQAPTEGQVTLRGGPAPFTCTGLTVGSAVPAVDGGAGGAPSDGTTPTSGTVRCAIPAGVTAFAGLGADVEITNGTAEGALVVPVTAVRGSFATGDVWVAGPDGEAEKRTVALGLTDGEVVQVTEGLADGDSILQFAPGVVAPGACADPSLGC